VKRTKPSRRKRRFRTLANLTGYGLARLLSPVLERLPVRAARFAGRWGGVLAFHLARRERRRALHNLRHAFPDLPGVARRRIARRSFENMGMAGACSLAIVGIGEKELRRWVVNLDDYFQRLGEILEQGRGFIALTAHLGLWESLAGIGARRYTVNVVANRLNFPKFNNLLERFRSRSGLRVIYLSESPREIVRALRRGEVVGLLPDQDIRHLPGVFVEFFGRPAYTPVGPVLTARVSRAPLVPFFMIHEGKGFRMLWEDPVDLAFTGDRKKDLLRNTQRWSRVFERTIRRYPEQWAWNHNRWKTKPADLKEERDA
jgi:KDO2-lipid IV(A) lauroyltransferase